MTTMTIGVDLHKRESQLCLLAEDGTATERRIVTSRERFTAVLGTGPKARVLLEASTESEWVARHLESLGHEVIVADPNYAPMYATRTRRVKTDKRDARALAEACRLGAYRPAHRLSEARRHVRAELAVRDALVRTRTRSIALAKALVRRAGLRVPGSESERVAERIAALELSPTLAAELAPLFTLLAPLNAEIAAADRRLTVQMATDPIVALLATAPGIGPVTASALVATIDDITRFHSAHQLEAYLGVVPGERSSGEAAARRPNHEGWECAHAVAARRGRVAHSPLARRGDGGAAGLDARHRHTAGQTDRDRRARAAPRGDRLCHVAGRRALHADQDPDAAAPRGGDHGLTSSVCTTAQDRVD